MENVLTNSQRSLKEGKVFCEKTAGKWTKLSSVRSFGRPFEKNSFFLATLQPASWRAHNARVPMQMHKIKTCREVKLVVFTNTCLFFGVEKHRFKKAHRTEFGIDLVEPR